MKFTVTIIIALFCFSTSLFPNDGLSVDQWEKATKELNYTETFKEFKRDTTKQKELTQDPEIKKEVKNPGLIKIIFLVVTGIILLTILVMLVLNLLNIRLTHKVKGAITQIEEVDDPDQYRLSDLEMYLLEAIKEENYRLALRIQFLMLIKSLKDNDVITWKKEKTNYDYFNELSGKEYKDTFKYLLRIFERVWYANYLIEEELYNKLAIDYKDIRKRIES
jgi:hypothetical protein